MRPRGEKVFITGATGFIGSNLARKYLELGAEVFINIRKTSDTWRIRDILPEVTSVPVDITEYQKLKDALKKIRPDFIFPYSHLWGKSRPENYRKNY